jgi:8-oxo-dGTP pyrophosphatase MutT (NUDIX family)
LSVWRPSVTVAAVIERGGRFLLVEEVSDGRHVLNQPAGHLDPGESIVDACVREAMEETGHRFRPTALVGVYRWLYAPENVTFLRFSFKGELLSSQQEGPLDREIVGLHWLTPAQIAARRAEHRSPLVQRCVDDFLAGQAYPLELFARGFE